MSRKRIILASLILVLVISTTAFAIPLPSRLEEGLDQVRDLGATIREFILTISAILAFFGKLLGFTGFFLFAFTLLTAAGLSAAGIPKGKYAFFSALLVCDALWMLWHYSAETLDRIFVTSALRSNLVVVSPFILFYGGRFLFGKIAMSVRRKISHRRGPGREAVMHTAREITDVSARMQSSLIRDIGEGFYSTETRDSAQKLRSLLDSIERTPSKEN
ncbi:MAG TPA: hypothetical protein VF857_01270 [Spirochaetota bacterium]